MLLAAEAIADPTGFGAYLAYGPLGLMVIGFLTGQIVPGRQAKRDADENDRWRKLWEERVLPLIADNTKVTEQALEIIRDYQAEQRNPRRRLGLRPPPPEDDA